MNTKLKKGNTEEERTQPKKMQEEEDLGRKSLGQ